MECEEVGACTEKGQKHGERRRGWVWRAGRIRKSGAGESVKGHTRRDRLCAPRRLSTPARDQIHPGQAPLCSVESCEREEGAHTGERRMFYRKAKIKVKAKIKDAFYLW